MTDELLIAAGGEIKTLGNGRVGGYLVRFSSPAEPDLQGDYFDANTDFDARPGDRVSLYYNHGMDPVLKRRRLGAGALTFDDVGVWVEAQLEMRDEYERAIYQLASAGKLGWSSGTLAHLVEREQVGAATRIKSWPLGGDASLTPTPAAGPTATLAQALKTLAESSDFSLPVAEESAAAAFTSAVNATENVAGEGSPDSESGALVGGAGADNGLKATTILSEEIMTDELNQTAQDAAIDTVTAALGELRARLERLETTPANDTGVAIQAPATIKSRGDSPERAFMHWLRTGDAGAYAVKASNDTDMNVGTAADGGVLVPTGHYQGIIAKMSEDALYRPLEVLPIPGQGTTVNVPVDATLDGKFVATAEGAATDRDAPILGTVSMTLARYTKRVEMSYELLDDESSRLEEFLSGFVGRGMAQTMNYLMITEALANGTAAFTLASATDISADAIPRLMYALPAEYSTAGASWIMQRATEGVIRGKTGSNFQFVPASTGTPVGRELYGAPIYNSSYVGAVGASAKSLLFGNFRLMGMRLSPDITVLRDPYSRASYGQVVLHYQFRTVFRVLQSAAIVYATHPAS